MDKDEREIDYSAPSVVGSIQFVIVAIIFLLMLVGILLSIFGIAPKEDQISPYPAPSSNPTVKEWSEPNFDNLDQDGFIGGQR